MLRALHLFLSSSFTRALAHPRLQRFHYWKIRSIQRESSKLDDRAAHLSARLKSSDIYTR